MLKQLKSTGNILGTLKLCKIFEKNRKKNTEFAVKIRKREESGKREREQNIRKRKNIKAFIEIFSTMCYGTFDQCTL